MLIEGKYTSANIYIDELESSCMAQITKFCNHPAFTNPIAIMPDAHAGMGSCIGFSMKLTDKVIPNIVGVDIGCGALAARVPGDLMAGFDDWWMDFDRMLRNSTPTGHNIYNIAKVNMYNQIDRRKILDQFVAIQHKYCEEHGIVMPSTPSMSIESYVHELCRNVGTDEGRIIRSIGTLGGGNHYIEIGQSEERGNYWVTVHSGSRNLGLRIANYHQKRAKRLLDERRKDDFQQMMRAQVAPGDRQAYHDQMKAKIDDKLGVDTRQLEWLEGRDAVWYLMDMVFAQVYAELNRSVIMANVMWSLNKASGVDNLGLWSQPNEHIESVHNYIDFNDMIVRKGAIRSYQDERIVIPLNMRDGFLLCTGKSNEQANFTAPHGAGRLMSRTAAKQTVDMDKFEDQMKDVHSTSVCESTKDEAPDAYKDSELLELLIEPMCVVHEHVRPVYNLKDKTQGMSWKERKKVMNK